MTLLTGGTVLWEGEERPGSALLFSERVLACLPEDRTEGIDAERIEAKGLYISPGFINVHVHGSKGYDFMDASDEAVDALSRAMAEEGTTAFLPTSVTASWQDIDAAVDAARRGMHRSTGQLPGAAIPGVHLEGPWIEAAKKGSHPEEFIQSEFKSENLEWLSEHADVIRTVTFSPVLDPGHEFIRRLLELKIIPSLGHTTADFETAVEAVKAGAKCITHLFNAQSGLHHRAPGMIGAASVTDVMCELIADGRHVRPELFEPLCRLIGTDRLILITDALRVAGMPDGEYDFAGGKVRLHDGLPFQPDGTIAGSALKMNEAVRNFWRATKRPLTEIVKMASGNPARLLGLTDKGMLAGGMDADVTCFDGELRVSMTFVRGRRVF